MYDDEDMWGIDAMAMMRTDVKDVENVRPMIVNRPQSTLTTTSPKPTTYVRPTTTKPTITKPTYVQPIKPPIIPKPITLTNKVNIQVYSVLPMFIKKGIDFKYVIYDHNFNKKLYEGEAKNGFVFNVVKGHRITIRVIPKGQYIGDIEKTITVNKDTVVTFQFVPSPIQALFDLRR